MLITPPPPGFPNDPCAPRVCARSGRARRPGRHPTAGLVLKSLERRAQIVAQGLEPLLRGAFPEVEIGRQLILSHARFQVSKCLGGVTDTVSDAI